MLLFSIKKNRQYKNGATIKTLKIFVLITLGLERNLTETGLPEVSCVFDTIVLLTLMKLTTPVFL